MHLRAFHPRVAHVTGPPVAWSEYLVNMGRRSVLVVFDIRRYQDDVVSFARNAAERGARVVLVTDQWLSPIAAVAEHVFAARIEVPSRWDSSAALLTLMEALIARINDRHWQKLQGRIEELERLRAGFELTRDARPST
jgi:DNA-binding MurR/RpiR family transcriptional regulator